MPFILRSDTIGSGFAEHLDPAALVIGPTGVGLGRNDTLYVADTVANRIAAIPHAIFRVSSAGRGITVSRGGALNGPLGLVVAPGGNILTVNSGNGNLVEVAPFGVQVAVRALDTSGSPPAPARCSAWRSSRTTAPSTSWTTPPTPSHCSTRRSPRRPGPRPGQGARPSLARG